jgi:hypothetical protein
MSGGFCHIVLRLVETGYTPPFSAARTIPLPDHFPFGIQPIDKSEGVSARNLRLRPRRSDKKWPRSSSGEEAGAYDAEARWVV